MRKVGVVWFLAVGGAVFLGAGVATAQRSAPVQRADSVQVVPDWEASDALMEQMIERNTPKPMEVIKQEMATSEIGRSLAQGRVSVLVYMDPTAAARSVDVRKSVKTFAGRNRGVVKHEYGVAMPNVINLRDIPEGKLDELKSLPGVVKVELDQYHPDVVKLHDSIPLIRGLQSQINAAGYSADGSGVRVCIVDTGIDTDHVMYADRIDLSASYDFYNNDSDPEDDAGHGSHCAGIIGGKAGLTVDFGCGAGAQPFQGVAPGVTLISEKVLNAQGGGYDSDIIAGIDHCADQSPSGARADVISMSIGTGNYSGICTHSWAVAANNAVANGVVAIAASGNENNSNSMGSPACGASVIAVGAVYKADYPTCEDNTTNWNWGDCTDNAPNADDVVCFSNESDYLDVTAPGANIWSASIAAGGGSIVGMSGTSMACPHVSGLAALILGVDPTLTPAEVRQIIRDGAVDLGPAGFDRAYGYGRIDVLNTLALVSPSGCTGDGDCDDGQWCNGSETCNAGSCQAGTDPCPGQSCDEVNDQCVAAPTVQYEWNMNSNPGWTAQGQWAWGQPTGGGGQHGYSDPTSGATGSNVYGYNLSGDYPNNLSETNLTTGAIDCSGLSDVSLQFRRWLGVEQPAYDHAYVRVSTNGSSWTTIWQNTAEVADGSWTTQSYDISSIADGQSTVYIRWTMGTTDSSWQYCGWNIDDVQIWGAGTGGGCTDPSECDDGLWCNGAEDCVSGSCVAGTAPNCNDGVACTDDSCNEGTDSCDHVANDGNCDNGLWCDGSETCHATLGCQSGSAPNCNDGVACTDDSCNEGTDSCDNTPNNGLCDDGVYCNGAETCNASLGCQSGSAVNCNDGIGCTDDSCNEGTDSCDHVANDAYCPDDGQFCNGTEFCSAATDCSSTGDPCAGNETCNESTDTCDAGGGCVTNGDCDDGNACTVDTCNGGVCTNACAGSVSSYPYAQNFDSGLGDWTNVGGDVFDWTLDANGTPSSSTGPSGDHTTGSGNYVYIETSSPRVQGDYAILQGPCLDLTNASLIDFSFWYHMYGSTIGTLDVQVSDDCTTWTSVWSLSGNQGNAWYQHVIYLDAYAGSVVKVRFVGTRGSSYTGDIAIDDIGVDIIGTPCSSDPECDDGDACTDDACVGSVCQNTPIDCDDGSDCSTDSCSGGVCYHDYAALVASFPDTENYSSGFGDWTNVAGDDFDWIRRSGSTPSSGTGPSGDHTTGSGYYIYVEASSPNYPSKTTILEGPNVDLSGSSSADVTFWYHMYGSNMGTLYLEATDDCVSWTPVWSLSGNQGTSWHQGYVDLSAWTGSVVTLRLRGVTGSSYRGDICVDDFVIDAN